MSALNKTVSQLPSGRISRINQSQRTTLNSIVEQDNEMPQKDINQTDVEIESDTEI